MELLGEDMVLNVFNRLNRKGQGAIEYMLVIGGAILVAAIVISVLLSTSRAGKADINSSTQNVDTVTQSGNDLINQNLREIGSSTHVGDDTQPTNQCPNPNCSSGQQFLCGNGIAPSCSTNNSWSCQDNTQASCVTPSTTNAYIHQLGVNLFRDGTMEKTGVQPSDWNNYVSGRGGLLSNIDDTVMSKGPNDQFSHSGTNVMLLTSPFASISYYFSQGNFDSAVQYYNFSGYVIGDINIMKGYDNTMINVKSPRSLATGTSPSDFKTSDWVKYDCNFKVYSNPSDQIYTLLIGKHATSFIDDLELKRINPDSALLGLYNNYRCTLFIPPSIGVNMFTDGNMERQTTGGTIVFDSSDWNNYNPNNPTDGGVARYGMLDKVGRAAINGLMITPSTSITNPNTLYMYYNKVAPGGSSNNAKICYYFKSANSIYNFDLNFYYVGDVNVELDIDNSPSSNLIPTSSSSWTKYSKSFAVNPELGNKVCLSNISGKDLGLDNLSLTRTS